MNPQMMQFGNQPGGYPQPGNYAGGYLPPGGGPPPPGQQPASNQPSVPFAHGGHPPSTMQNNIGAPPAGFIMPGSQGPLSSGGPVNKPINFQGQQISMPLNNPSAASIQNPSHSSNSLAHLPPSLQPQGPPPPPHGSPTEPMHDLAAPQGVLSRPPGSLGPAVSQSSLSNGPQGPQVSGSQSQPFGALSGSVANNPPNFRPGGSFDSSSSNGAPPMVPSQNVGLQSPGQSGQLDSARQYINGTPQPSMPGPPFMQSRPPFNFGLPPQAQPPSSSTGPVRPMYLPSSNINNQSPNMPPQQLSSQSPYPHSQQIRPTYPQTPPTGNFNKGNYPSGPPPPPQNEI